MDGLRGPEAVESIGLDEVERALGEIPMPEQVSQDYDGPEAELCSEDACAEYRLGLEDRIKEIKAERDGYAEQLSMAAEAHHKAVKDVEAEVVKLREGAERIAEHCESNCDCYSWEACDLYVAAELRALMEK